jgi:hypothetical protein
MKFKRNPVKRINFWKFFGNLGNETLCWLWLDTFLLDNTTSGSNRKVPSSREVPRLSLDANQGDQTHVGENTDRFVPRRALTLVFSPPTKSLGCPWMKIWGARYTWMESTTWHDPPRPCCPAQISPPTLPKRKRQQSQGVLGP